MGTGKAALVHSGNRIGANSGAFMGFGDHSGDAIFWGILKSSVSMVSNLSPPVDTFPPLDEESLNIFSSSIGRRYLRASFAADAVSSSDSA